MRNAKILIVEDDIKIAKALQEYFEDSYFKVLVLNSGEKVVDIVQTNPPDLILLDIMLPEKDGMTICREIRHFSNVPIIMITARIEPVDRLLGLELGADDYICKPFIPGEVVARVKALLRRAYPKDDYKKLVIGSIVIDDKRFRVTIEGSDINLTPIEFQLLKIMMSRPDQVFTRSDLISKIQGYNYDGYDRTIDNHIKNLRKKIHVHLRDRLVIETVHGIGYKFSTSQIDSRC